MSKHDLTVTKKCIYEKAVISDAFCHCLFDKNDKSHAFLTSIFRCVATEISQHCDVIKKKQFCD
jgi:hypothetical protein